MNKPDCSLDTACTILGPQGVSMPAPTHNTLQEKFESLILSKDDCWIFGIRHKFATGLYSQRELANDYNVTKSTITKIVDRTAWSHIP